MPDDLVTRLREESECYRGKTQSCLTDAADHIEQLEAALRPFAQWADAYDHIEGDDHFEAWDHAPTIGMLRAARAALEGKDD